MRHAVARRSSMVALALAAAAAFSVGIVRVRTDDPVSSNVRFTGDIVRIFDRKCVACHSDQGLSMPLTKYGDVRSWGRAIREEIVEQRMPPSSTARGYGHFRNDLSLTARETLTILSWIDGGMPRGDDRELPPARVHSDASTPDVTVPLPAQRVVAGADHEVRRIPVDLTLDAQRSIARIGVRPGTPGVVRGALVFEAGADGTPGRWLGAWLPWQPDAAPPAPHALVLHAHARLIVEVHYRGGDTDVTDRPSLEIDYGAQRAPTAGQVSVAADAPASLSERSAIWAIVPSPAEGTTSLQVTAREPDGAVTALLWIPHVNRDWPQVLLLEQPVDLPKGTVVALTTTPTDRSSLVRLATVR